jgi:hypothetical protein
MAVVAIKLFSLPLVGALDKRAREMLRRTMGPVVAAAEVVITDYTLCAVQHLCGTANV